VLPSEFLEEAGWWWKLLRSLTGSEQVPKLGMEVVLA